MRILAIAIIFSAVLAWAISAIPEGAQTAVGRTETRTSPTPGNVTADGGNVTEVNISISSQTQVWQGFFGEINGSIVLEDASGDLFYSWNVSNVSGEVYASRRSNVNFAIIFPMNNCTTDNILTGASFSDSANETFFPFSNSNPFAIGLVTINASTACSTHPYVSSAPTSGAFEEIVVSDDPNNRSNASSSFNSTTWVGRIHSNTAGFDGATHDYQLLVPVNRTAGVNVYFFYAELG